MLHRYPFIRGHATAPESVILDLDATDDLIHGKQEGRSIDFNLRKNGECPPLSNPAARVISVRDCDGARRKYAQRHATGDDQKNTDSTSQSDRFPKQQNTNHGSEGRGNHGQQASPDNR